jgi:hypothetical protein
MWNIIFNFIYSTVCLGLAAYAGVRLYIEHIASGLGGNTTSIGFWVMAAIFLILLFSGGYSLFQGLREVWRSINEVRPN